jgi:hypothetical protein
VVARAGDEGAGDVGIAAAVVAGEALDGLAHDEELVEDGGLGLDVAEEGFCVEAGLEVEDEACGAGYVEEGSLIGIRRRPRRCPGSAGAGSGCGSVRRTAG